jgi:hypothetical protein
MEPNNIKELKARYNSQIDLIDQLIKGNDNHAAVKALISQRWVLKNELAEKLTKQIAWNNALEGK